jgi:hypothetical protein
MSKNIAMHLACVIFMSLTLLPLARAENAWKRSEKTDPLRGTSYVEYVLPGTFLSPPKSSSFTVPLMVVHCLPRKRLGGFNGTFLEGFVAVGTVLNTTVTEHEGMFTGKSFPTVIPALYRLDGGKVMTENWSPSTDGTAAYFNAASLGNFLFGHILHKRGTTGAISKVRVAFNEYLAAEVVMQFDMPDPTEVAESCGITYGKK